MAPPAFPSWTDQVTAVLAVPVTVAAKACDPPMEALDASGVTDTDIPDVVDTEPPPPPPPPQPGTAAPSKTAANRIRARAGVLPNLPSDRFISMFSLQYHHTLHTLLIVPHRRKRGSWNRDSTSIEHFPSEYCKAGAGSHFQDGFPGPLGISFRWKPGVCYNRPSC